VESTAALSDRPEVAASFPGDGGMGQGWRKELPLPEACDLSRAVLRIDAVGSDGFVSTLAEGTVKGLLLRLALYRNVEDEREKRVLRETIRSERERFERQLAEERTALRNEIQQLEARIAAMKASRFWKLRDRWFALKRFLRLTTEA
jgi:hypothetical protein